MSGPVFETVLVANRGEIAVRVIRTLRRLGIRSVAVYSDADAGAPHVELADEAVRLGPAPAAESYLSIDRVLAAARASGAQAIHPGYGFLSENSAFAAACAKAGVAFVGPSPEAMDMLGNKVSAKILAEEAGVPTLPGLQRPGLTDEEIIDFASEDASRLPLMIKAAAGGGGRGMRVVRSLQELADALASARREAKAGFADDTMLVERLVDDARHIEVQVLADTHGTVLHLGERECSLQRRHQKVIEESPSPAVSAEARERMGEAAVALARRAGYVGAGTVEFLLPADSPEEFFFLEVNARLQVEHPVTELVTGLDLVELQLRIAAGEPLALTQEDVTLSGHAIEARLCAEDPANNFVPAIGEIVGYREARGVGVRIDSGVEAGGTVTTYYDSLLCKVIASGPDREAAVERLERALQDTRVLGLPTNAGYLARLLADEDVRAGRLDTGLIERGTVPALPAEDEREQAVLVAAVIESLALAEHGAQTGDPWDTLLGFTVTADPEVEWEIEPIGGGEPTTVTIVGDAQDGTIRVGERALHLRASSLGPDRVQVELDGRTRVWDHAALREHSGRWLASGADAFALRPVEQVIQGAQGAAGGALEAPMPGTVIAVNVAVGDEVEEGQVLVVVESMKMELTLVAPAAATVLDVHVAAGDGVSQGQSLVDLEVASA
ncbi:MAG TPA: biotin carboxylase N-terminal domain-containing protein [Solirubrobacteraceae bacterium]|jgi:acetyl-CoA/propionyl-CoA carboxylase biotin carboxyl carrier protein|nr:biotin carboxylase N-terminal domain-containing protein [Solirubrobacteraceae bacterium]